MRSKHLFLAALMTGLVALGAPAAHARTGVSNVIPDAMPPVGVDWTRLTLEAHFPKPFGDVKIVVKQGKEKFASKITGIEVFFHGHALRFPDKLLKGLVMASDPGIGYNLKHGKVTSLFIFFQYGYPVQLKAGDIRCISSSGCTAYPVAEFLIDKNFQITRHNSLLPVSENSEAQAAPLPATGGVAQR